MKPNHPTWLLVTALLLLLSANGYTQSFRSYVERTEIQLGDSLDYVVETDQDVRRISPPDGESFNVVTRSARTNVHIINGQVRREFSYRFRLAPRTTGTLSTGAAVIEHTDGSETRGEAFEIVVHESQQANLPSKTPAATRRAPVRPRRTLPGSPGTPEPPATKETSASGERIPRLPSPASSEMFSSGVPADVGDGPFITAAISDDEPFEGEQLVVDYLFYSPVTGFGLNVSSLTEPDFTGVWFEDITEERRRGNASRVTSQRVNGRLYEVHLIRSYLAVPLESGRLIIPSIETDISEARIFGRGGSRTIGSPPLELNVRSLPDEGRPADFASGNVGRFEIESELDAESLRVGDTGRVRVRIYGVGLASQITPPDLAAVDSIRTFPSEDSSEEDRTNTGWHTVNAWRSIPFSPKVEGEIALPAVRFSYFDPWLESYQTVETALEPFLVEGVRPGSEAIADESDADSVSDDAWLAGLPDPRRMTTETPRSTRLHAFSGSLGFFALLASPLLLMLFVAGFRRFSTHRAKSRPQRERERAGAMAQKRLNELDGDEAADFGSIAQIIRDYVSTRTGEPCRGASLNRFRDIAGQELGRSGFELASIVQEAEEARFGGGTTDTFKSVRERSVMAISAAEEHQTSEESRT